MIFLRDALETLDCPICLQSLGIDLSCTNSTQPSPEKKKRKSESTSGNENQIPSIVSFAPGVTRTSDAIDFENGGKSVDDDENLVVVLTCGHFIHWLCAVQLCEYYSGQQTASCPVCRKPIAKKSELVPFLPKTVPHLSAEKRPRSANLSEEDEEDDVRVVGMRTVAPSCVYVDHIARDADHYAKRVENVKSREGKLNESKKQLEEEIAQLRVSISGAKERMDTMFPDCRNDPDNALASATRLENLRKVCKETKWSSDRVASEMAVTLREKAELIRQIEKYERKLKRMEPSSKAA
ncbi:hypothetical protein ADEAN_000248900 [Angomonas deanei]|uniref:RING-type domain-containing protein n=1 Tax=Angomonas deanei TaxID=59799 RepID=A0A7G2C5L7_9TRYP|nr:hypothetical protein ADEAN_000248900 [Angomonas deanei]